MAIEMGSMRAAYPWPEDTLSSRGKAQNHPFDKLRQDTSPSPAENCKVHVVPGSLVPSQPGSCQNCDGVDLP